MMKRFLASSLPLSGKYGRVLNSSEARSSKPEAGFTLIETLVALTLLTVAVVAPISLTAQSLSTAYYARDQITAYYLAQEGLEVVRSVRDHNVLENAYGNSVDLMSYDNTSLVNLSPFTVDTTPAVTNSITKCATDQNGKPLCPALQTDPDRTEYGYNIAGGSNAPFTRAVTACYIQSSGADAGKCTTNPSDEVRVSVTVSWYTGNIQRSFTITEDMYRWVSDNAAV